MKTTLHTFRFDTSKPEERKAWEAFKAEREVVTKCFETWGGGSHYISKFDGVEVELDTTHLFDNQWNTLSPAKLRVFDWAMDYHSRDIGKNPDIKQGHYLDQTEEMTHIRANTLACGWCGRQEPLSSKLAFCPHCYGSQYLTSENLHLTRMRLVSDGMVTRAPLTKAEEAELHPRFIEAQTKGVTDRNKAQIAKARADVLHKWETVTTNATTERDGMLWLMDHGLRTDNVIYYNHTGKFSFGWRTPLSGELLSRTTDLLCEFPFDYEIKRAEAAK